MKKILSVLKSKVALTLSAVILVTTIVPSAVRASEEQLSELEELLIYELSEENIEVEDINIYLDEVVIDVSVKNVDNEVVSATIEFAPGDSYITFFVEAYNDDGIFEVREFIVDLTDVEDYMGSSDGIIEVTVEDVNTGEIFEYNSYYGVLADVIYPSMVLAGIIASLATLQALLVVGLVVIIVSVVWLVAVEADTTKRKVSFKHFRARIHKGQVVVSKGISTTTARNRLRNGNNTWSPVRSDARKVAQKASGTLANGNQRTPFGPENHASPNGLRGNLYMYHYHPNPRANRGHAFYGFTVKEGVK